MSTHELPFFFDAGGAQLFGIVSTPRECARIGVVIVVGGPQYRVGSHRQFVLLARALADAGVACIRFDHRGMGDSEGAVAGFGAIDTDIRAAVDAFFARVPSLERVILWGLCDGASASAFYSGGDSRVAGLALYNPWVRTERGEANAMLRHYYAKRLVDATFWRKLAGGELHWRESATGLWRRFAQAASAPKVAAQGENNKNIDLPNRIAEGIGRHAGPILIALSGNDTVAAEFKAHSASVPALANRMARQNVSRIDFPGVDHTFSCAAWRDAGAAATIAWMRSQFADWISPAHTMASAQEVK
ncbi:MAG: hydrolase 1, exosortase A system-associated [Betaproteobacteria bacterium]